MPKITINQTTDVLGVIGVQATFMEGGELSVPDGEDVIPVINRLLERFSNSFAIQVWHPPDHVSFASAHPGKQPGDTIRTRHGKRRLWPDHAVQDTKTARVHPDLLRARFRLTLRTGNYRDKWGRSAFVENEQTATGLHGWLNNTKLKRLFLTGLPLDFAVAHTAVDGRRLGYQVFVISDACRGLGLPGRGKQTTIDIAKREMGAAGVQVIKSKALVR